MSKLHALDISLDTDPRIVEEFIRLLKKNGTSNNMPAPHTHYMYGGVTYAETPEGVRLFFTDRKERWQEMLARIWPALEGIERFHAPYKGLGEIWAVSRNMETGPQPAKWQVIGFVGSGAEGLKLEKELNKPWPDAYKVEPVKVYATAADFLKEVKV